jgi:hypothetical protein
MTSQLRTGNPLTFFYSVCLLPVAGDVSIWVAGSKPLDSQAPVRDPTYGQVLGTGGNCGKRKNVKIMALYSGETKRKIPREMSSLKS